MIEWLAEAKKHALVVATKIDKLGRMERAARLRSLTAQAPGLAVLPFSAVTREGGPELQTWIEAAVRGWSNPRRTKDAKES